MLDFFNDLVSRQFSSINIDFNVVSLIEISIIVVVILYAYKKFIQGTQSERLVKGIFMLLFALLFSKLLILLKLQIIGKFLESLVSIVIFGLVVIFQPELRRFLGYIGQTGFLSKGFFQFEHEQEVDINIIDELTEAAKFLSKSRTGALIVIEDTQETTSYYEVGTKLNANVSTELILTIFHPNTPLHDGALVINENKILSAGVLLPLTEDPKLSWQYGTRHRAAIGVTENSDAVSIVVSEETGDVSIAYQGELKKCEDIDAFRKHLSQLLNINTAENTNEKSNNFSINNIFSPDFYKKGISKKLKLL